MFIELSRLTHAWPARHQRVSPLSFLRIENTAYLFSACTRRNLRRPYGVAAALSSGRASNQRERSRAEQPFRNEKPVPDQGQGVSFARYGRAALGAGLAVLRERARLHARRAVAGVG